MIVSRVALGLYLVAAAAVCSAALYLEIAHSTLDAMAARAASGEAGAAPPPLSELEAAEANCLGGCSARGLEAASVVRLAIAANSSPAARGPLVAQARADLERALRLEPYRGEAAIRLAYAASLQPGAPAPEVLDLVARSYAVRPYSKTGGLWRIGAVIAHWRDAPARLKTHAMDEAAWLYEADPDQAPAIDAAFASGHLELAFALRRSVPRPKS